MKLLMTILNPKVDQYGVSILWLFYVFISHWIDTWKTFGGSLGLLPSSQRISTRYEVITRLGCRLGVFLGKCRLSHDCFIKNLKGFESKISECMAKHNGNIAHNAWRNPPGLGHNWQRQRGRIPTDTINMINIEEETGIISGNIGINKANCCYQAIYCGEKIWWCWLIKGLFRMPFCFVVSWLDGEIWLNYLRFWCCGGVNLFWLVLSFS